MSETEPTWELERDPTDDEIRLLFAIIRDASQSRDAPFKAFFAAYDSHFAQRHLEKSHDNVIYRLGMRVVHAARRQHHAGRPTNMLSYLISLLDAHGITCIEDDEDDLSQDITRSVGVAPVVQKAKGRPPRRASFDDARLDETWLSEHATAHHPIPPPHPRGLLSQPPRRGRNLASTARARSISSHSNVRGRYPAPKHFQRPESSDEYSSEDETRKNPTLLFQPSQTQLEQNAEAFFATSELRSARRYLHIWHDQALAARSRHTQAYHIAAAHDRRLLLKQSLDIIQECLHRSRAERAHIAQLEDVLAYIQRKRNLALLAKAFSHWDESTKHQKRATSLAQMHMLKVKYFNQWRRIAVENAHKVRVLLGRKYIALWRDRIARRLLAYEQADAHYEQSLMKRCYSRWFWSFCSRQVEGWHERRFERHTLATWRARLETLQQNEQRAISFRQRKLLVSSLSIWRNSCEYARAMDITAEGHYKHAIRSRCLQGIQKHSKLRPLATRVSTTVDNNLKLKAMRVWLLHLNLSRQAADVDRKRLLQTAWTNWNDSLRCKALGQRIDQRILVESLYRWTLQHRLVSFQKWRDNVRLQAAMAALRGKTQQVQMSLDQAEAVFMESQRCRRLQNGLLRLNSALRQREDAERAAIEFANSRALPRALESWKDRKQHLEKLERWATDARFYCLASRSIERWRTQTTEHRHQRRREAYRHIRVRIKIRMVRSCFEILKNKTKEVENLRHTAEQQVQARLFRVGTAAFDTIRVQAAQRVDMDIEAASIDRGKLLVSALLALTSQSERLTRMEHQALLFRQESELALAGNSLRKLQWATFTAARQVESADALWARNRDQHIRQMLRFWAAQATTRREGKMLASEASAGVRGEVETSPSLRPASRMAARSADRVKSSPVTAGFATSSSFIGPGTTTTPGYLRTPSRGRRAGRFRPLPTPAPATPIAFDPALFATTPAHADQSDVFDEALTGTPPPHVITPFARKLRAGGVMPPSALRSSVSFGPGGGGGGGGGTSKSVRFARSNSRFSNSLRQTQQPQPTM